MYGLKTKIMNIYYKRKETFCEYPFNQEIDEKWIEYSLGHKKNFKCFLKSDVSLNMQERTELVAKHLNQKKSKICLMKAHW
jgi:hypothetical protein